MFDIPAERWMKAIGTRRSRRTYVSRNVNNGHLDNINNFCNMLNKKELGVRIVFINEAPDDVLKGAIGSYGKIKGAPAYAIFIINMEVPNIQEKVGYIGEAFILEATAIGLATCWVGGFFKPESIKNKVELSTNEEIIAVTPVGYAGQQYSITEKMLYGMKDNHKRKDLESLCSGLAPEDCPPWVKIALESARLAPSAINRQPWRFEVSKNTIKISLDNPKDGISKISKRLDCGIAMLHLEIGALYSGVNGTWEYLADPDVALYKKNLIKENYRKEEKNEGFWFELFYFK